MTSLLLDAFAASTQTNITNTTLAPSSGGGGLNHDEASALDFLLVCFCLITVLLTAHACHLLHWAWLSEAGAIIILGIVVGGVFKLIDHLRGSPHFTLVSTVQFQHDVFINVILPLIILEAGYSLKHSGIVRNLGAILNLAIAGTLVSTLVIGVIVYYWSKETEPGLYNTSGGLFLCFTFGSLLSATDPVSVISLLSSKFDMTQEPPLLYNLVFGESVLNDAVAIVLFEVFIKFVDGSSGDSGGLGFAILNFIKIFSLSSIIGYVVGLLLALLFRFINFRDVHHVEVAMMTLFAAVAYYLCDLLDLSGIMGLFVAARTIGHHGAYNMSRTARDTAPFVLKTLAALAECAVFFLLGTAVWAYKGIWNAGFAVSVIVACLISRAVIVFPLCGLSNLTRSIERISFQMQIFIWYSGLRGAIAFGLVAILHGKATKGELGPISPDVTSTLLTSTLSTILFTVLVMGAGASPLLSFFKLDEPLPEIVKEARESQVHQQMGMDDPLPDLRGIGWFIRTFEKRFIEAFVRRQPEDWHDDLYVDATDIAEFLQGGGSSVGGPGGQSDDDGGGQQHHQTSQRLHPDWEGAARFGSSAAVASAGARQSHAEWGASTNVRVKSLLMSRRQLVRTDATTSQQQQSGTAKGGGVGDAEDKTHSPARRSGATSSSTKTGRETQPLLSSSSHNQHSNNSNIGGYTTVVSSSSSSSAMVGGAPGEQHPPAQQSHQQQQQQQRMQSQHHHHPPHHSLHAGWQDAAALARRSGRLSTAAAHHHHRVASGEQSAPTLGVAAGHAEAELDIDEVVDEVEYNPTRRPYEFSRMF